VKGDTDHDNLASQHVMTAVGMRLVAEDDLLKYYRTAWTACPDTAYPDGWAAVAGHLPVGSSTQSADSWRIGPAP
jgi:hypothetical protein